ncbi:TBC1 domain family member 12-like isoform X2 [Oratosquilla oratoria]|uniref:TBC1 domain family member 12-like isoform X2 n=1 Tax=Oratosquilla oratoria TaxID=337810 RepID=UPI003F7741FB
MEKEWFRTWPERHAKLKQLLKKKSVSDIEPGMPSQQEWLLEEAVPTLVESEDEYLSRDESKGKLVYKHGSEENFDSEQDLMTKCFTEESHLLSHDHSDDVTSKKKANGSTTQDRLLVKSSHQNVSLDTLLESIPLVYDPVNKQLCLRHKGDSLSCHRKMSQERLPELVLKEDPANTNKPETEDNRLVSPERNRLQEGHGKLSPSSDCVTLQSIQEVEENEGGLLVDCNSYNHHSRSGSSDCANLDSPKNTLQRVSTHNSLSVTDTGSFSSLSSSNTELSLHSVSATTEDSAVGLGSQASDNSSVQDLILDTKVKRKGITDFITRNLFAWRNKDGSILGIPQSKAVKESQSGSQAPSDQESSSSASSSHSPSSSAPGWRIFSRGALKGNRTVEVRNSDLEAGTVGLIMENRPSSLPAKTTKEQQKHDQEYQEMVTAAKKKEQKEAKARRKAQVAQLKQEEQVSSAVAVWNNEIIPKWDTMHSHKRCQDLWWQGLPSCVRGKIWRLSIRNELNITPQLYNICLQRSKEKLVSLSECGSVASQDDLASETGDHEATIDLIKLDVSRTFPQLCIFQKGGPFHDPLHNILGAYVCYRPDVGYVQGMSFLAATLLLNMEEGDAFQAFTNLLNRPAHMAFFRVDQPVMCAYYQTFEDLLFENLPNLASHMKLIGVTPDLYVLDWLLTVFARPLPLDAAARIWDVYLRDGEEFLIRAAIGILKLYENVLLHQDCTATAAQFLTRLPEDLSTEALFRHIALVHTGIQKRTFSQILHAHMETIGGSI